MNHLKRSLSTVSALAVLCGLTACADHPEVTQPANTIAVVPSTPDEPSGTMGSTMAQGTGMPDETSSDSTGPLGSTIWKSAANLDDAQIAAVVIALDQDEIQEALFAQSKSRSSAARRFAAHLLTSYEDMLTKSQVDFSRAQVTATDSAVSLQLQGDGRRDLATLQSIRGQDFDREYVDAQIEAHNQALDLIDGMLPNVKSPELEADLRDVRSRVYDHLREAERVRHAL